MSYNKGMSWNGGLDDAERAAALSKQIENDRNYEIELKRKSKGWQKNSEIESKPAGPTIKQQIDSQRHREKYASDPEYRERCKKRSKENYQDRKLFKKKDKTPSWQRSKKYREQPCIYKGEEMTLYQLKRLLAKEGIQKEQISSEAKKYIIKKD